MERRVEMRDSRVISGGRIYELRERGDLQG